MRGAAVRVHKDAGGAQDAEQVGFVKHAADELLLGVHAFGSVIGLGPLGFPGVKVF